MSEVELRAAYTRVLAIDGGSLVVHELRELREHLGTLVIAIIKDPDPLH